MTELIKRPEFTQDQLEGEISNITENIKHLEISNKGIEDDLLDPNDVSSKLIELEDRSRWKIFTQTVSKKHRTKLGKIAKSKYKN